MDIEYKYLLYLGDWAKMIDIKHRNGINSRSTKRQIRSRDNENY